MNEVTTKDPAWNKARTKLGSRGNAITAGDICLLFAIPPKTCQQWAEGGKLGAKRSSDSLNSHWRFNVDKVREELGMEPLAPEEFSPDNPQPSRARRTGRGRAS